jgi:anti-sigma regulatory factor (Ser/Thr protein kinase)
VAAEALRITVRCDNHAPMLVRRALAEVPEVDNARGDALLVASELVSNAVRHSDCTAEEWLTVCANCDERQLRISVLDPGLAARRAELVRRPLDEGGLGLRVVDELAECWGTERSPAGCEVWAEVALSG